MVTPSVPEVKLAVEIADAELVMDNCCELPLQIVAEGGLTVASNGFTVSVAALGEVVSRAATCEVNAILITVEVRRSTRDGQGVGGCAAELAAIHHVGPEVLTNGPLLPLVSWE